MKFTRLLEIVGQEPVFETGLLLAGEIDPADVRRQLSRWTRAGRLIQLRRGVYALAPPYRKVASHPFVLANAMVRASYVSLQSALSHYGMIPEHTPVTTSVTTRRTGEWPTPMGYFLFRHVKTPWFCGYTLADLDGGQRAYVATPAKALLDLVYLTPSGDSRLYLEGLRLSNLERVEVKELVELARESGSAKLARAAMVVQDLAAEAWEGYEEL